ncbi:MAG: efflux RND transporter periplasmic adaptor subunit [Sphingobacteriales bacterium]|jgi:HlyD family secretion protein|nr:efflux RND transporter periplasmic adaptor subunit [Sphingobacteriales bacterium]MBP9140532.1 efflux RND transporter periplasmic adaptor subunit [Chitinophagales bacterium]MDA0197287.1 efflux RND transporter periplasmic adaptor subunit [Bacteroidota bacterium]MBK6890398.1 efflux RND transporter periplasmic adaptor subunit [Sphingobacteriales bacterium]MBK7526547.1 efflux RND transporter periplasmic adaptor subunit [Sphingobacteriales bacterium]
MATKQKSSNLLRNILIVLTLFLIIIAVTGKKLGWFGKAEFTKVAVEKVERRSIIETVAATGKVYPELEVKVSADVSGEVVELLVQEGDSVKAGQLLAKINPDLYESAIERAEAAVNASKSGKANAEVGIDQVKANRKQLETQLANAQKTLKRSQQLLNEKVIAQVELDNAELAVKNIEQQIAALDAQLNATFKSIEGAGYNVKSAEATLKEARDSYKRTTIYAPMSGIVSKLGVEKGERVVGTTQMSGTEILRIANFANIEVRVDVSENDILRVNIGDTATVEVDAYLDRKFKGVVTEIANSAKELGLGAVSTNQITNFTVHVRLLPNSYADLYKEFKFPFRPGMSASVDIQTKKLNNVLTVPIQAVTTREDSTKEKTNPEDVNLYELVFVHDQGKVHIQKVKVGIQDETYIEIIDGLTGNEEVVAAPYRAISKKLKNDQKVTVVTKEALYQKENIDASKDEENGGKD